MKYKSLKIFTFLIFVFSSFLFVNNTAKAASDYDHTAPSVWVACSSGSAYLVTNVVDKVNTAGIDVCTTSDCSSGVTFVPVSNWPATIQVPKATTSWIRGVKVGGGDHTNIATVVAPDCFIGLPTPNLIFACDVSGKRLHITWSDQSFYSVKVVDIDTNNIWTDNYYALPANTGSYGTSTSFPGWYFYEVISDMGFQLLNWAYQQANQGAMPSIQDNTNYYVRLAGTTINAGDTHSSTVVANSGPACPINSINLTASAPTPSTAVANTAQTFASTISNIGTASTGASFSNFFQVASAANGGGTITDLTSTSMTTLAAGGTNTASKSYTFVSTGTYSVRACADKTSSAGGGVITESNENDNCSTWTNVTVTVPDVDLTASAPAPSTAATNIAQTFTSTISNIGNTSTGTSFNNFFQVAGAANGGGTITDLASTSMSALNGGAPSVPGSSSTTIKSYTFTSTGTYSVRACADKTSSAGGGVITETDENNNCSPWTDVVVSVPGKDLTAAAPTPSTALPNVAQTYSSTITNLGSSSTVYGFSNFFQVASSANGGGTVTDLASTSMAALVGGASSTATKSYTFTSTGTYSMRACADKTSSAGGGVITEIDETNNCSAWTNVLVTNGAVPAVSISASPSSMVLPINSTVLTWTSSGATACVASGDWSGAKAVSGSQTISSLIAGTYTYTVVCSNAAGNSNPSSATVLVNTSSVDDGDGVCTSPAKHYTCSTGSSSNNNSNAMVGGKAAWTWTCGFGKGAVDCTEIKVIPGFIEN